MPPNHKELSEGELEKVKDEMYKRSLNGESSFNGLYELVITRENIISAIRKVKSNGGFKTAGVDLETGQTFLNQKLEDLFKRVLKAFEHYEPFDVRQVEIPKRDGRKRPLGIPAIIDRVIQTAVANIIEPILEAKMYEHSYGFRPLREIEHAVAYISALTTNNQRHWVVEGDIKGFFNNIDHNIMVKKLHKYGVTDKRILALIKKMLKAGIHGFSDTNLKGVPQGGTISTLLANVYLTDFDHWVDRQWRSFQTNFPYKNQFHKTRALKETNLKQGYLIRYADDWIILTDCEESAQKWKFACINYLRKELKIELNEQKTIVTNLTENHMDFLGIRFKKHPGRNNNWTLRTEPTPERLNGKVGKLREILKNIKRAKDKQKAIGQLLLYNSVVRGLKNFYKITTLISPVMSKQEYLLLKRKQSVLETYGAKLTPIEKCSNLKHLHERYGKRKVYAIADGNIYIGAEPLSTVKYVIPKVKAQWITPYTPEGRKAYENITGKAFTTMHRNPNLTLVNFSNLLAKNSKDENNIYTAEYFINRPMAFNRDKGKCRDCNTPLTGFGDFEIHHEDPTLPIDKVNKLTNLVTLCLNCHIEEHRNKRRKAREKKVKSKPHIRSTAKSSKNNKPKQRRSKKPDRQLLFELIQKESYTTIGKMYGVSDNAVKKWAISYGIHEFRKYKRAKNK